MILARSRDSTGRGAVFHLVQPSGLQGGGAAEIAAAIGVCVAICGVGFSWVLINGAVSDGIHGCGNAVGETAEAAALSDRDRRP